MIGLSRKGMSSVMLEQKLSGKSWLKICSSRLDCSPPPPWSSKLDWIREEKIFIFFTQKINWKKYFVTYYWVQSHTYTKIWWSYVLKLQWVQLKVGLQLNPPLPEVANWTGFVKKKFSFFSLRKSTEKNILSPGKSVCWHRRQPI